MAFSIDEIKCDIVIPVWNELALIQRCIHSVLNNTASPYRIILVDNGSEKKTAYYLKEMSEKKNHFIKLIRNSENLGFPKAVNQGIELSDAPHVCILNSDTEVYKGWLEEMLMVAENNRDIGVINPCSNNLGYEKPINGHSGEWIEMSSCIGFCMLIKREVIEKIGNFDEIYSPGNFEDADFSKRAVQADYTCVMAKAAYVYHTQNIGFKKRSDWQEKFNRNRGIFTKRWGAARRKVYIIKGLPGRNDEVLQKGIRTSLTRGDFVWVVVKAGTSIPPLPEHLSLSVFTIDRFFALKALWRVLKRKKRFDSVLTDSGFLRKALRVGGYAAELI